MHDTAPAYGLWSLVIVNSAVFILFVYILQAADIPRLALVRGF